MTPRLATYDLVIGHGRGTKRQPLTRAMNLAATAGQFICLFGSNGAGKSTLLRTLAGLQPALAGRVEVDSVNAAGMDVVERARTIAVVLTGGDTPLRMTVEELVMLGRHPYRAAWGRSGADDRAAVADALARVDGAHLVARACTTLSDGERQRVMVARALAQQPALLLLDEPTAFLDAPARRQMLQLLRTIARERSLTVIASTHEIELAAMVADTAWLVADGHVQSGAPTALAAAYVGGGSTPALSGVTA